jgi:hypothetical protein
MCIDFTDLNKCCPKDDYPLSRIERVVDSVVGCEMMALLDCFWVTTRYGYAKKMRKIQVSLQHVLLYMNP